jgi:hypothetical protein
MKRCPTCQRTFDDNMKFCQADGTPLISDTAGAGGSAQGADFDPMKTVLGVPPPVDLPPPSPFGSSSEPPRPPSTDLNSPSFGDLGGSSPRDSGFSDAPRSAPTFQEPEPQFGQQPFGNTPSDWSPPPAPAASWGNQGLGQNTPFTPPPMGGSGGQNQTLAIVSLVTGILGLCCQILGPVGLITGYIAYNNANKNPAMYGGKGLALGGMIVGGIATLLMILWIILNLLGVVLMPR